MVAMHNRCRSRQGHAEKEHQHLLGLGGPTLRAVASISEWHAAGMLLNETAMQTG